MFSGIQFSINDDLIYYIDFVNRKRLCLFKKFEKEIFEQIHDRNHHAEFIKTYEVILINFYFRKLSNRLQRYIAHCRECNLCQIKRHQSYDNLNSIISPSISYYTMSFDFILSLSFNQKMNAILSTTCKFFKKDHDND